MADYDYVSFFCSVWDMHQLVWVAQKASMTSLMALVAGSASRRVSDKIISDKIILSRQESRRSIRSSGECWDTLLEELGGACDLATLKAGEASPMAMDVGIPR